MMPTTELNPARELIRVGFSVLLYGPPKSMLRLQLDGMVREAQRTARVLRRPPNVRWAPERLADLALLLAGVQPDEVEAMPVHHRHVLIDVLRNGSTAPSVVAAGQAITALVRELMRERPLLVVVDELHLLDRATADVLAMVTGALGDRKGLQVAAAEEVLGVDRPWGQRLLPRPDLVVRVDPPRDLNGLVTL